MQRQGPIKLLRRQFSPDSVIYTYVYTIVDSTQKGSKRIDSGLSKNCAVSSPPLYGASAGGYPALVPDTRAPATALETKERTTVQEKKSELGLFELYRQKKKA